MAPISQAESNRDSHLDGLRGIAALSVAVLHFFRAFNNDFLSPNNPLNNTLISALWNGHFAVTVFFSLSGLLFLRKFYGIDLPSCLRAAAKRYLRLAIPIFALSIIALGLHAFGLFQNVAAASKSGSDWLVKWYRFEPDIRLALAEPLVLAFVSFDAKLSYNTNLWTISYELFGVFVVIAFGFSSRFLSKPWQLLIIALLLAVAFRSRYFDFFLGAALALFLLHRPLELPMWGGLALIAISSFGARLLQLPSLPIPIIHLAYPLASVALILAIDTCRPLRSLLSQKVFTFLGRISFGVYLIHMLMLCSVASSVYLRTESLWVTFIAYVATTIPLSILFWRALDQRWMVFLNGAFRVNTVLSIPSTDLANLTPPQTPRN